MPIPTRRLFLSSAVAVPLLAAVPLQRRGPKPRPTDPMLDHFDQEAARIKHDVEKGDRGPTQARALEHLYRVQAVHFVAQGYNDEIRRHVRSIGREVLAAELLNAAAAAGKAPLTWTQAMQAIEDLQQHGIAGRWIVHAEFWKAHGPTLEHGPRAVAAAGGQWYYNWCPTAAYMMDVDENMLMIWCGASMFMGWLAQAVCGVWSIELGAERLVYQAAC